MEMICMGIKESSAPLSLNSTASSELTELVLVMTPSRVTTAVEGTMILNCEVRQLMHQAILLAQWNCGGMARPNIMMHFQVVY
jgi:hypothetical protein